MPAPAPPSPGPVMETAEVLASRRHVPRAPAFLEPALLAVSVLSPALLVFATASNVADVAHDLGVIRTVGLGWTGAFRALDAPVAALTSWLPLGTRAFRAALAGGLTSGAAGAAIYALARAALSPRGAAPAPPSREPARKPAPAWLPPAVAAIASLSVTLSPAWQVEALGPGGAVLGALLSLLPALAFRYAPAFRAASAQARTRAASGLAGFTLGLAFGYEPLVGLAALLALAAYAFEPRAVAELARRRARAELSLVAVFGSFFLVGLLPLVMVFARLVRAPALSVPGPPGAVFTALSGERGESGAGVLGFFLRDEATWLVVFLAVLGAVFALAVPRKRRAALAPLGLVLAGALALACGAPAGPTRYGAPVLAMLAGLQVLAAIALNEGVSRVARARVRLASVSAALVVVLLGTLPVRLSDESLTRRAAREPPAEGRAPRLPSSRLWDESVGGALPTFAVVIEGDPRVVVRLLAARATGSLPAGLLLVPSFDLASPLALLALGHEPSLVPYFRDRALVGAPAEASLSGLAAARPLAMAFDPQADRRLAFHLLPRGLFLSFEPDARGASDRRAAFEAWAPSRNRLLEALVSPMDPELVAATGSLVRGTALAFAATGDRDLALAALGDVRRLAPGDPFADTLARRIEASAAKGTAVDLSGLSAASF